MLKKAGLSLLTICAALQLGSTADAARAEFGRFGDWDIYRLDFPNTAQPEVNQVCAARGFYENNYKVIFAFYNDHSVRLYVERPDWTLPSGFSKPVRVEIRDRHNASIYDRHLLLSNDTPAAVKQFRFNADWDFVKAVLAGFNIYIHSNPGIINFNIADPHLNEAIAGIYGSCFPTMIWVGQPGASGGLRIQSRSHSHNPFY